MDSGFIDRPLKAIVRKGKEHFFCRFRHEDFIEKLIRNPEKHEKIHGFALQRHREYDKIITL